MGVRKSSELFEKDIKMNQKPKVLLMEARENLFGHKRLNEAIINTISTITNLTIVFPEGWIKELPENVKYYSFEPKHKCMQKNAEQIIKSMECMRFARELDKKMHFDYIFFSASNVFAMVLSRMMYGMHEKRVLILHHNISDQLDESVIKRICFEIYKKKTRHVLIEDFMKHSFIKKHHVPETLVYSFPHPLNVMNQKFQLEYDYTGISNSNDDEWIRKIISKEEQDGVLRKNRIRMLLRSGKYKFDNGFLTVFRGRLEESEYYEIIMRSRVILIPFPKTFKYRISASVVDAFSNRKKVIGSNIPLIKKYEKDYPHICKIGIHMSDIIRDYYDKNQNDTKAEREFLHFSQRHSQEKLEKAFINIFSENAGEFLK